MDFDQTPRDQFSRQTSNNQQPLFGKVISFKRHGKKLIIDFTNVNYVKTDNSLHSMGLWPVSLKEEAGGCAFLDFPAWHWELTVRAAVINENVKPNPSSGG